MPKRRPKGSGSLIEISPGTWRLRVPMVPDPKTGARRHAERRVAGDAKAAEAELATFARQVRQGAATEDLRRGTLGAFLVDEWLPHMEGLGRARSTLESYATIVRAHIVPELGRVPLADVSVHDIERYYATKRRQGLPPNTIRTHAPVLSRALCLAHRWRLCPENPVKTAEMPGATSPGAPLPLRRWSSA